MQSRVLEVDADVQPLRDGWNLADEALSVQEHELPCGTLDK